MHDDEVDFRKLTMIKNTLFDSDNLRDNHFVSLKSWKDAIQYLAPNDLRNCEAMILKEIMVGDEIDLMKFVDIVDLFFFLPMKKFKDRNDSKHTWLVLSSNTHEKHSHIS